jgi:hypothetical protein
MNMYKDTNRCFIVTMHILFYIVNIQELYKLSSSNGTTRTKVIWYYFSIIIKMP